MTDLPAGQFGVIYCDPPWAYETYSAKGLKKSPQAHYDCMTLDEMKQMRDAVLFAAAPDAACVMWCTFPMLPQAMELMRAWGFTYKTGGAWVKRSANGKPSMGTGYVLRGAAELFLIGTVGAPAINNRATRNVLLTGEWPAKAEEIDAVIVDTLRREHSRKPDEMVPVIENLFSGPYLELFAELYGQDPRDGWAYWGKGHGNSARRRP